MQPPALEPQDKRNPAGQAPYRTVPADTLPLAESLKDTIERVVPYFEEEIRPKLLQGEKVLIAAHGNSLRALVMYLEHLSRQEIVGLNLPTGVPLVYHLDEGLAVKAKEYLGDYAAIQAKMQAVANQGKIAQ